MTIDTNAVEHPINRRFEPDLRVCFKAVGGVQNGGCHLDVYGPTCKIDGPVPLMLYAHGGGFTVGASVSIPYRQVRWLLAHGIAVVSVEYRMLPHVKLSDIREDGLDAYRFVQNGLNGAIKEAGLGWTVDRQRVGAWGASAGGTFVLLLTADALTAGLPPLRVLVPNYPGASFIDNGATAADVAALRRSNKAFDHAFKLLLSSPCSTGATRPLLPNSALPGGLCDGVEKSLVADIFDVRPTGGPVSDEQRAARVTFIDTMLSSGLYAPLLIGEPPYAIHSPMALLSSSFPPTFVIIAGDDKLLPNEMMRELGDTLVRLGVETRVGECAGMNPGHVEALPHQGPWPVGNTWWQDVVLPSLELAAKHLAMHINA